MSLPALAAILFALGAIDGVTILVQRLHGRNPPIVLAALHGVLVLGGLVTLAVAVMRGSGGLSEVFLGVFGLAALGGMTLLYLHARGTLLPIGLALLHGGVASVGFLLLVLHLVL